MNWRGHWWFRLQEGRGHQGDLASELLEEHYGGESDGACMGNTRSTVSAQRQTRLWQSCLALKHHPLG